MAYRGSGWWGALAPWCVVACAGALLAGPVHAGQSCDAHPPSAQVIARGMEMAAQTSAALEAEHARTGARVVALGRAGQDLSRYRLTYSHMGWAYRTPQGPWRVVHKLNDCGTALGHVYRQGLGEFFLDDLWRYQAVWAVPTTEVQDRLYVLLQNDAQARALQHAPYSMVSYVWGRKYQQSNQWALETLARAMEPASVHTRDQAQAWLQFKGYTPSALRITAMTRLGARVGTAHIAFDDHPSELRFADRIETVTVDSALAWLTLSRLAAEPATLVLKGSF